MSKGVFAAIWTLLLFGLGLILGLLLKAELWPMAARCLGAWGITAWIGATTLTEKG